MSSRWSTQNILRLTRGALNAVPRADARYGELGERERAAAVRALKRAQWWLLKAKLAVQPKREAGR